MWLWFKQTPRNEGHDHAALNSDGTVPHVPVDKDNTQYRENAPVTPDHENERQIPIKSNLNLIEHGITGNEEKVMDGMAWHEPQIDDNDDNDMV